MSLNQYQIFKIEKVFTFLFLFLLGFYWGFAEIVNDSILSKKIDGEVQRLMKEGDIPGLSLAYIDKGKTTIKVYGYADVAEGIAINSNTLFELGSCSKAFTALAILRLFKEGIIAEEDLITEYIPWFHVRLGESIAPLKIKHLLHHTSGIPWSTISLIPETKNESGLRKTIEAVNGVEISFEPGKSYEYATVNYDILAFIIETVTKVNFEEYMQNEVFEPMGLYNTGFNFSGFDDNLSLGYKIGFFQPRVYNAPRFSGNNAAGYIISNINDLSKWLKYQLDIIPTPLKSLIDTSHQRDKSVAPHGLSSYAAGWQVSLAGNEEIYHSGMNPNFSSYIAFRKQEKIGVALLANSNSSYTQYLGERLIKILANEDADTIALPSNSMDSSFSIISIILSLYILAVLLFFGFLIYGIRKKTRKHRRLSNRELSSLFTLLLTFLPVVFGVYLFPKALADFSWGTVEVWTPISFLSCVALIGLGILLSYLAFLVSTVFPENNKYVANMPKLVLLSIISGLANMLVIVLITSSFQDTFDLIYSIYYFTLAASIYLITRKVVQSKIIWITRDIIYDLRMQLVDKVFLTSYEKFEKIDRGRIYATMNDDIGTIGQSADAFVGMVTSIITTLGAFVYLATLDFWATLVTVIMIIVIAILYFVVGRVTNVLFEEARETQNVYMNLLNGMIDGFKELSIQRNKSELYRKDLEISTDNYRKKITKANVNFVDAFLIGESLLIVVLATTAFVLPELFPTIRDYTLMSFVVILLYLIGPINGIFNAIPKLLQLRVSWNRIQQFIDEIPANLVGVDLSKDQITDFNITNLRTESLTFEYENGFGIGPIDLELKAGEVLFVIGGNGSGKTTFSKLLTGLYSAKQGKLFIDEKEVEARNIGKYYTTVFNPFHLFQKTYLDYLTMDEEQVKEYLKKLRLDKKVSIKDNEYSTISLSGGQRKRLALLQCYMEDKPICLFDEWAADQDPEFRKVFYRELLPEMKQRGKIVIAISHDDHYFDVADKILKLNLGKVEYIKSKDEVFDTLHTES